MTGVLRNSTTRAPKEDSWRSKKGPDSNWNDKD
jgi:hypothetical protein